MPGRSRKSLPGQTKTKPMNVLGSPVLEKEQSTWLWTLLEASRDGIAILDGTFCLVECNRSFAGMLGYRKEELIGKHVWDWDATMSEAEIKSRFGEFMSMDATFVTKQRCKDQSTIDVEITITVASINEQPLAVAVCRDITKQRQEHEALLKTQFAIDHARDNCVWSDAQGRIVYANFSACKRLGYSREEITKLTIFDIDPDFTYDHFQKRRQMAREAKATLFETRHITKNGQIFPVEISANHFGDDAETFLSCAFARDITKRKEIEQELQKHSDLLEQRVDERTAQLREEIERRQISEKALRESEAAFRALVMYSKDAIIRFDREFRILNVNPMVEEFVGLQPEQLLGRKLREIGDGVSFEARLAEALDVVFQSGRPRLLEVQMPNGIWLETLMSPEYAENDEVAAVVATSRNISDRKKAEEEVLILRQFEGLLMELASSFINLPLANVDEAILVALGKIGHFVKADRAYVFLYDFRRNIAGNTHEWCRDGIRSRVARLKELALDHFSPWVDKHRNGEVVHIPDLEGVERKEFLCDTLLKEGVRSFIAMPMMSGGECVGFLGFESATQAHTYSREEQQLLSVCAELLLNIRQRSEADIELSRQYAFQELIADIAADFVEVSRRNFDLKIKDTLRRIGAFLGVDRSALFFFQTEGIASKAIVEWCNDGIESKIGDVTPHPITDAPPSIKEWYHREKPIHHWPVVAEMADEHRDAQKALQKLGVQSALFLPIHTEEKVYGIIGFEMLREHFEWSKNQINGLCVVAQILANGMAGIQARDALLKAKNSLEERVQERTRELEEQVTAKEAARRELATTQSSLLEASRYAGMTEVATDVLHNVGNVLNSINVSCTVLIEQLRQSRVGNIQKVADLLGDDAGLGAKLAGDSKGKRIPLYLSSLANALQEERKIMLAEANLLNTRIDHVKEIVAMQQNYSRIIEVQELVDPRRLMDDAVLLNQNSLLRSNITVRREYDSIHSVLLDKHKVLLILTNLVVNAKNACNEKGTKKGVITLRISETEKDTIRMVVADDGIGIRPDQMAKIFQHGYTTRRSGHGFGLHSSALAAKQLRSTLLAHSDGPGKGAVFTLEIPVRSGEES